MKRRIVQLLLGMAVLIFILFLTSYKLDYYIYQPGSASALDPFVSIEEGYDSEGDMHLVTVRGGQATPIYYLWAKIRPFYHIYPIEQIRPEGISQEEYNHIQLEYMDSSQDKAIAVAFQAANKEVKYEYTGVYVTHVFEDMPASEVFQIGDKILSIDGNEVSHTNDISGYVQGKTTEDTIEVVFLREGEELREEVHLASFPSDPEIVGMGISLVTERDVITNPKVEFDSGDIGGPSAGLMFSLEIYDRITEIDFTKGYQICGTGTISADGTVGRIGGIDQKVVASDNDGCDVFFAPNEKGVEGSNYQIAKETAEEIDTDMEVIPVDSFSDAVEFLEQLEAKAS
jgi:Lon-like protease